MTGERRQLTAIGRLIEGKENERKVRLVAKAIEQGLQPVNVIGRGGNVGAYVAAKTLVDLAIVIAVAAGMELHHEAVLYAHARHLGQHLSAKQLLFGSVSLARNHPVEERRRCG